jgi:hypothetical protein
MQAAFKEWAIVVDALGQGKQIIILRKGGINEGRGGFRLQQNEFLLFPTLFHQQRESVIPAAQERFDQISPHFPKPAEIKIDYFARVESALKVDSFDAVKRLHRQHIWKDEVLAERFNWGREELIYAIAVRVFRLAKPFTGAMLPEYGGCKSWINLAQEVDLQNSEPILSDQVFAQKLSLLQSALSPHLNMKNIKVEFLPEALSAPTIPPR